MDSLDLKTFIEAFINREVEAAGTGTQYRRPLVGFADAADPGWLQLRKVVDATHFIPAELLPGAETVVAYFLPFAKEVVQANREAEGTAPLWALAYQETNALLNHIAAALTESLSQKGVRAVWQPATHNWDPQTQVTRWSHKSVAALAGLGSFGLHQMLITDLGCAGRFGSVVIDARVEPTSRPQPERCLFLADGSCTWCVKACPAGALTATASGGGRLDKDRCRRRIDEIEAELGADVCGKCAVGPCSLERVR